MLQRCNAGKERLGFDATYTGGLASTGEKVDDLQRYNVSGIKLQQLSHAAFTTALNKKKNI